MPRKKPAVEHDVTLTPHDEDVVRLLVALANGRGVPDDIYPRTVKRAEASGLIKWNGSRLCPWLVTPAGKEVADAAQPSVKDEEAAAVEMMRMGYVRTPKKAGSEVTEPPRTEAWHVVRARNLVAGASKILNRSPYDVDDLRDALELIVMAAGHTAQTLVDRNVDSREIEHLTQGGTETVWRLALKQSR